MATGIEIFTIESFDTFMFNATLILTPKFLNKYVVEAIQQISAIKKDYVSITKNFDYPEEIEPSKEYGLLKNSPFYRRYSNITEQLQHHLNLPEGEENIYYNIDMFNIL